MQGLVGHDKEFAFYSNGDEKSSEGVTERNERIQFTF